VSESVVEDRGSVPARWPDVAPAPYGYLVACEGPPAPLGLIADVVLDGAGLYLAAATPTLGIRVRLARATVPGLPVVPTGVNLIHGPIEATLWHALVQRARGAMPSEVLFAIIAREPADGEILIATDGHYALVEPQLDESGTGSWQPQQTSGCSVRATPVHDAIVEVHSHHAMRAYFATTDDRDETGRRVYGILGRLDTPNPEIALRAATGCQPHAVEPVAFAQVFAADLGAFRDVHYTNAENPASSDSRTRSTNPWRSHRPASLLTALVLDMAEDLSAIRALLDTGRRAGEELVPRPWMDP
jgi:PRTRC genetic system protein A